MQICIRCGAAPCARANSAGEGPARRLRALPQGRARVARGWSTRTVRGCPLWPPRAVATASEGTRAATPPPKVHTPAI
eukprot:8157062-Pyramimonas_sp.AAC.1